MRASRYQASLQSLAKPRLTPKKPTRPRKEPKVGLCSSRPRVVVTETGQEPPPPAAPGGYKRLHPLLRPFARLFDVLEAWVIQVTLDVPALRAWLLAEHGYGEAPVPRLYRGITDSEARALRRNGWAYDALEPENHGHKFATTSPEVAKKYAPPGGVVVALDASRAVRWYEISRRWSREAFVDKVQEHVIPLDQIVRVRPVEPSVIRQAADNVDLYRIHKIVHAGETVELELEDHRKNVPIEQIDLLWDARYAVPDPSRGKTPEGKPFYKDGVYASTFLVDAAGRERRLDKANFVDVAEEDNLHDLGLPGFRPRGERLRLKFFAKAPEGEGHPVRLKAIRVCFCPSERPPQVTLQVGKIVGKGETLSLELPEAYRGKKLVRVEARWTDMLSGTWTRPGRAVGTLLVDGALVGQPETVQSPETQSFNARGLTASSVGLLIDDDPARIDWVRVYFED